MRSRLAALTLSACLGGGSAFAQPMSAINWLTDSVALPSKQGADSEEVAALKAPEAVDVRPLDAPLKDAIGLVAPDAIGLPDDLWAASDTATLNGLFARTRTGADTPVTRALLIDLLTLAAGAPAGGEDEGFLLARVDKLLELAALDKALAMLERADLDNPRVFRRWFDIRLLMGTEDAACARLDASPDLAPTFPTRIFCLARGGDWETAALSLDNGEALGLFTPAEDALLLRFLDGSNSTENGPLVQPGTITPLSFRLYEAVGEPIPTEILPRAFAQTDLAPHNGWKARLAAGERLAAAGVLTPADLFALYAERKPAASGGVWDRAAAVQALNTAIDSGNVDAIGAALTPAWSALAAADLAVPFAVRYGARLMGLALEGPARRLALRIALLSPAYRDAAEAARDDPALAFLSAVAEGRTDSVAAPDQFTGQVREAFADTTLSPTLQHLLDESRSGEALLTAIDLFTTGTEGDSEDLIYALRVLRRLGLEDAARRAALAHLIIDRLG